MSTPTFRIGAEEIKKGDTVSVTLTSEPRFIESTANVTQRKYLDNVVVDQAEQICRLREIEASLGRRLMAKENQVHEMDREMKRLISHKTLAEERAQTILRELHLRTEQVEKLQKKKPRKKSTKGTRGSGGQASK